MRCMGLVMSPPLLSDTTWLCWWASSTQFDVSRRMFWRSKRCSSYHISTRASSLPTRRLLPNTSVFFRPHFGWWLSRPLTQQPAATHTSKVSFPTHPSGWTMCSLIFEPESQPNSCQAKHRQRLKRKGRRRWRKKSKLMEPEEVANKEDVNL